MMKAGQIAGKKGLEYELHTNETAQEQMQDAQQWGQQKYENTKEAAEEKYQEAQVRSFRCFLSCLSSYQNIPGVVPKTMRLL
jgi:hypothetical protein